MRRVRRSVTGGATAALHGGGEVDHELVAAVGNEERNAEVARPGEQRGGHVAAEIQRPDGLVDLGCGHRAHAGAAIEDPVDGCQRDAGGTRHVVHGCPLATLDRIQPSAPRLSLARLGGEAGNVKNFSPRLARRFAVAGIPVMTGNQFWRGE